MKKQKVKVLKKKRLPKDFTIKPKLSSKYDDQPLFQDKVDRANYILKTAGIPNFDQPD